MEPGRVRLTVYLPSASPPPLSTPVKGETRTGMFQNWPKGYGRTNKILGYLKIKIKINCNLSATHVTLNESDASESITRRSIKSLIAHFRDNAHFSKIKGCLGSVSCTK